MAHFAKIENGIVTQVIVVGNEQCGNLDFPQSEPVGQQFIKSLNLEGEWRQTSYNRNFRKNFAATGFTFDKTRNAFIPPKPYESWILNENTCQWNAPTAYPSDDSNDFVWNEDTKTWVKMNNSPEY